MGCYKPIFSSLNFMNVFSALFTMFTIIPYSTWITYLYYFPCCRWSKWLTAQFLVQLYLAQPRVMRSIKDFRSLATSGAISQSTRCQVCKALVHLLQSNLIAFHCWRAAIKIRKLVLLILLKLMSPISISSVCVRTTCPAPHVLLTLSIIY